MDNSVCTQCGTSSDTGLIFCKQCGATLRPPIPLAQFHRQNVNPAPNAYMRIRSLRVGPVARTVAILYGVYSPLPTILAALSKAEYIRIPLGLIAAPLFYVNINFDILHPTHILSALFLTLFAAACYAATGWLTGAVAVLCFNFVVRRTGGIEASILTNDPLTSEATS